MCKEIYLLLNDFYSKEENHFVYKLSKKHFSFQALINSIHIQVRVECPPCETYCEHGDSCDHHGGRPCDKSCDETCDETCDKFYDLRTFWL